MPLKFNKKNKPYFECGKCEAKLVKGQPVCYECQTVDQDALEYCSNKHKEYKKHRFERASQEFEDLFDEGFTTMAFDYIKRFKQATVWQLLVAFKESGVLDRLADTDQFRDIPVEMRNLGNPYFLAWAKRRIISLGKWWDREGVVFLATKSEQGHPYLFILPGNVPEDIKEIKSKAEWSVKNAMRHNFSNLQEKINEVKIGLGKNSG